MKKINKDVYKNKWPILFVVVLMTFMACIDSSIVNVALPLMSKKLSASMASIEWVIVSYVMTICSIILIFGRLGDIKGKIKVFRWGIVIFTLASFMCGFSNNLVELVFFRIIQGIGAAAYMANNQGIITQVFPKSERGKALGILGSFAAMGTLIGPPAGGFIISLMEWNYIFLINVPLGIAAFILGLKVFPKSESNSEKIDMKGAVLFFIVVICLFTALTWGQKIGYNNPIIILGFVISIVSFVIFIKLEDKIDNPLLQLNIFKNNVFSLSLFCAFISFICLSASGILIPFYLQDTLKLTSRTAGVIMMVQPLIIAVLSPLSGNLSDKIGSEFLTFLGLIFTSIGFLLMSFLNEKSSIMFIISFVSVIAVGNALFQPSNNSLIMSSVPRDKLGIAGSVNSLTRNLGQIFGVTLATSFLYVCMSYKIGYHVVDYIAGRDDVFIYGMRWVYAILVVICGMGWMLTAFRLYKSKTKTETNPENYKKKISHL
ncbi:MFS transporter [Clostridium sp. JS66]|uniref:MFS transporter n=1 Tax=Clostridium sp. JS66 TaxID=3064705 RepID=UPI00298DB7AA|nr:MFS transporter [Clostridium sp. JS66]WPC44156.1 MFS transporter [Clostridium sp. JS66]